MNNVDGILDFLRAAEGLKSATRTAWTSGGRRESVAEHTWRLCLMAMVCYADDPGVDVGRLIRMCLIHDLGETLRGDIPAPEQVAGGKSDAERADLLALVAPLPERQRTEIVALWDDYEAANSPEARAAKGLDKLETILQHIQGMNPAHFDYAFNLEYGQRFTSADPMLAALRTRMDRETLRLAEESGR